MWHCGPLHFGEVPTNAYPLRASVRAEYTCVDGGNLGEKVVSQVCVG